MDDLLLMLITSFYLNLSRNPENIEYLLDLKIFKKLRNISEIPNEASLCYTNTIFAKILRVEESHDRCLEEQGYQLFINILKAPDKYQFLFLETLDSIKLLLTKRKSLKTFNEVAQRVTFQEENMDLNISFLQVLAILSFEKENHPAIKSIDLITQLEEKKIFQKIFGSGDSHQSNVDEAQEIELALALSIIVANLSCEDDFLFRLLTNEKDAVVARLPLEEQKLDAHDYTDRRLSKFLNLLAHKNPYISEQISILLANVSNSVHFKSTVITDRCIKAMIKIINFNRQKDPTNVSVLAILITLLNLSTHDQISVGLQNLHFMEYLEKIIELERFPFNKEIPIPIVNKAIALLAVSNMFTLSQEVDVSEKTKEFALHVLQNWKEIDAEAIIKNNLVYAALILFYNIILKEHNLDLIKKLGSILHQHILCYEQKQIVDVVLELITLFTRNVGDSCNYVLETEELLQYTFQKLKSDNCETLELACLAMSRLAASLEEDNMQLFLENMQELTNFTAIGNIIKEQEEANKNNILRYYLNFLENTTSFKAIREQIQCTELYKSMLSMFREKISNENCISIINVLFNINFALEAPMELDKEFLRKLCHMYKDDLAANEKTKIKRKVIVIVVSATGNEANHKRIIEYGFYTQFKANLNENIHMLTDLGEEIELFGLVNIALNKKNLRMIHRDLKNIHMMALKNEKVDFKTNVDLFSECSKFLSELYSGKQQEAQTEKETEIIENCITALLFSLIKLIDVIDMQKFIHFKYLLNAILECTKNFKSWFLIYLIKIDRLIEFLLRVLKEDLTFEGNPSD